ncbi:hypothetical protein A9Q84_01330 [Halobacteriovorax marinus]|uniref:DUF3347 domain-containing protein n=1 Tax=Halobacteriovorax marinus TaxID=97084 RepID=A0A1Y5FHK9_9BACT|nr:hypothetical protein A9Q84_01330 [Halobacteriovorax marinus]
MKKIVLGLIIGLLGFSASAAKIKLDNKAKAEIIKTLEANEELHASFFKYDGKNVETTAMKVSKAMGNISNKDVAKLLKHSKMMLTKIKADSKRDENNQNYHMVSMALIHIMNKYDLGEKYSAYRCPMVKKKWIQNTKKMGRVHNPYAPSMPHCGGRLR